MKKCKLALSALFIVQFAFSLSAQTFTRTELSTQLQTPWEIHYGADNFLWISEFNGKVSRVSPTSGEKTVVYTAADYFAGADSEKNPRCGNPGIGYGTLGLCLDPDFSNPANSFIYLAYSYNSGSQASPKTQFKIVRLTWDASQQKVTANTDIALNLPTGYDHLGGRLIATKENGIKYLYFSSGDNGISEDNSPDCYEPQSTNPNNFTQDPTTKNGKIHRFLIDGSIPSDNPIANNSFYTRGHRNPQGLAYNAALGIVYNIEHGDHTDDEINVLEKGMNYGWKTVRGYHNDNNFPGEAEYISNYTPNPAIANDKLVEPIFSWCATPQPTTGNYLDWCTVAPSGAEYYANTKISSWNNSILVVTLKNGANTDQELYQVKLTADGKSIVASTQENPNPRKYFGEDQSLNGRLRDLAISPEGDKIFLINNGGTDRDKITVYTLKADGINSANNTHFVQVFPNPANTELQLKFADAAANTIQLSDLQGRKVLEQKSELQTVILETVHIKTGTYFLKISNTKNTSTVKINIVH